MPIINTAKMSAWQFLQLGEDPPGVRLELVDGEIAVSPSASPAHSAIEKRLSRILTNYIYAHGLGELFGDIDTVFDAQNVRRPDLSFYSKSRLHLVGPTSLKGPPDLCVEIISPTSATIDQRDKFDLYQKHGVAHYWIINPDARTLEAYTLQEGLFVLTTSGKNDQTVHLPPFPDLAIHLADIWPA